MRLTERFRKWLAGRLWPEYEIHDDRLARLRSTAGDAYWWLGEFPDAADTIRWLLDCDTDRYRPLGVMPISKLPSSIGDFREHLRRRSALKGGGDG